MCHILTTNSTHYLIISGYMFSGGTLHYVRNILSDNFRTGQIQEAGGSDMLAIFDRIHCVLNLLAFG